MTTTNDLDNSDPGVLGLRLDDFGVGAATL
jgi:hypothetical protein